MHNKNSPLKEHIDDFIQFKKASGYKALHLQKILKRFCKCAEELDPNVSTVTKEAFEKWAYLNPEEAVTNQYYRINAVRQLSVYLNNHEIIAYVAPKSKCPESSFVPYIFSDEELSKFFTACDNTRSPHLKRAHIVSLVFRMIYCCGLRASEATGLTVKDVDLIQGTIFIRGTKFEKERLLPVHDDLLKRMKKYSDDVLTFAGQDSPFFPNQQGNSYSTGGLYTIFRNRIQAAGISHGGKGVGPRLHDLRHTFAVHTLRKAVKNGEDVNSMLKYLSVYLGHTSVNASQNYLRLTADMYPNIVCHLEEQFDVLPDVEVADETN
mgnify:FL=1